MNVIFMGTPDYASEILKALVADDEINVVAVYTQPDKPVGRKKVMTPPITKTVALENGLKVYQPTRLRDEETVAELLTIACDFIVVAAYGQILPKAVLDHAPCINLHASILPDYRGASPIQQAILKGDRETGVTAMLMDEGLDTGDILKIEKIAIGDEEMVSSLFERLTVSAAALTIEVLKKFKTLTPLPQNNAKASHCTKISKQEGLVTFDDAETLYNRYRAFTPWPGVYLESGLKLKKMQLIENEKHHKAGEILSVDDESVVVGCKKGSLRLELVQPASKKEMSVIAYLNGKRLSIADTFA
ncbi:methionyl-tRNA formyltransferase [Sulfurimonas sp. HSL3-7]|uniref:methionyl-tRNA formyltransferase n=1 Tax=Sulfonitrofixus jiaomeiensis TaxID=3131938 RepID=UPI0031F7F8A4